MAVLATFIGICATLIVGVQIVNHIELRNMQKNIKVIDEEWKKLDFEKKSFSAQMYNTRLSIGNALALLAQNAMKNGEDSIEFYAWIHSIVIDDWKSMRGAVLLARYERLIELSTTIIPLLNKNLAEDLIQHLSILIVPTNISHYDEIMELHHKLLSELKRRMIESSEESQDSK